MPEDESVQYAPELQKYIDIDGTSASTAPAEPEHLADRIRKSYRRFTLAQDPHTNEWKEYDKTDPHYNMWCDDLLGVFLDRAIFNIPVGIFGEIVESGRKADAEELIKRARASEEFFAKYISNVAKHEGKKGPNYKAHARKAAKLEQLGKLPEAFAEYLEAWDAAPDASPEKTQYETDLGRLKTLIEQDGQDDKDFNEKKRQVEDAELDEKLSGAYYHQELVLPDGTVVAYNGRGTAPWAEYLKAYAQHGGHPQPGPGGPAPAAQAAPPAQPVAPPLPGPQPGPQPAPQPAPQPQIIVVQQQPADAHAVQPIQAIVPQQPFIDGAADPEFQQQLYAMRIAFDAMADIQNRRRARNI
jgi:hypothetical protein